MIFKPELYLRRKFDEFLVAWKGNPRHLPLIVKGARQVGKTECVRHFAEGRYESFIEINFVERPQFKSIVRDGYSVELIVANITQIDSSIRFIKGKTLLFFDELQECPEIVTSLKFFAQDGNYDVILSGSLLGVHYHRVESFSVGYQESVELRSLDFEEFLWAHGYTETQLEDVLARLKTRQALPEAINETYSRLFLDYCVLGGMPDVLENYFLTKSFTGSLAVQKRILADYRADIRKYGEDWIRCGFKMSLMMCRSSWRRRIRNSRFQRLLQEQGIRIIGGVSNGWSRRELCFVPVTGFPRIAAQAHRDRSAYKLYLADTGLLVAQLDEEAQADVRVRRNLGTWKGGLFENIVAEALVKAGVDLCYYKKDNSTLEMDFFLRSGDDLVPVEVKSENARAKSLKTLIASEHYPEIKWGVKFIRGNVGFENSILTLPQWSVFLLPKMLREVEV